jgi:hypothetical protein
MMNRFRSLLVKQKQYATACENAVKKPTIQYKSPYRERSCSPGSGHSPVSKKPYFDLDSMKELITTIEESMKQQNKSSQGVIPNGRYQKIGKSRIMHSSLRQKSAVSTL